MNYTLSITNPRHVAALAKHLAAYNAGQADADKRTVEQLILGYVPLDSLADTYAPEWINTGDWLQRWTTDEKKAIRAMGLTNPTVQGWLDDLDANARVQLTGQRVQTGVPFVCHQLELDGFYTAGQGAVRAAEVLAF